MNSMKRWLASLLSFASLASLGLAASLERDFESPPESARPWVYWYFMDGNLTREGMTADLEAMKRAGIGGAIFLEVDLGIPRGPVGFMSPQWRELLRHAVDEAGRLGIQIALGSGPGWCGTGGPWVKPEQSMQHLVASETNAAGPVRFDALLPRPKPRKPYFGEGTLTPELKKQWAAYYQDVVVLAFPAPAGNARVEDIDEKALYHRDPFSSKAGVKPFLPALGSYPALPAGQCVDPQRIIDLTSKLSPDGRLTWDVPPGSWTILRFGRTATGQTTRPAPAPGLGFESDKFDRAAVDAHFESFVGTLLKTTGEPKQAGRGLTTLHFDSWEMSSQNWSQRFREEFARRRGYDLLRFLPVMTGRVVESLETSERFLWDLRQTAQELVVENHAGRLKELGRRHGMNFSVEPYDLNPCADLKLGGVADVPMCEFWSKGWGFPAEYSCVEAVSIAHTMGRTIVGAEAFTSNPGEDWQQYPGAMKSQTDWAFCAGINRLVFHRYQHQPWLDRFPGMTMGPHGIYWERTQTWWDMVPAYHLYVTRCQEILRRGQPVADILYLAPEGAPHVFRPPGSAFRSGMTDRLGHNFDGCDPDALIDGASVKKGRIVFAHGMSYSLLVLPRFDTMTPKLLQKIRQLVEAGATVMGAPSSKSPSLADYPKCDQRVKELAAAVWGPEGAKERTVGKGRVIRDPWRSASNAPASSPLAEARWIWHNEGNPAASAPPGARQFRRVIQLDRAVASAEVVMTADNAFELFVNGQSAGQGDNFHTLYTMDVMALLRPGSNLLAVAASNGDTKPNPAGLIGALSVRFGDGTGSNTVTDSQWASAESLDGAWQPARELGAAAMSPWKLDLNTPPAPEVYPAYSVAAQALSRMGVVPDFDGGPSVRYIHRREGRMEIYFVANRENRPLSVACRFRTTGLAPELWDPATGARRALPEHRQEAGVTVVPMEFAPFQSAFVVFRAKTGKPAAPALAKNYPAVQVAAELAGPWEVAFDPKWGGPEKITFTSLDDWSKRPEEGIQHYSGKAVYRKTFDLPEGGQAGQGGWGVELGAVHAMASVKVNGRDLGVAWCDPWRVEIPAGLLKARGNQLEITVANLWINRLIGDSGQPEAKRLTWTTRNPYRKDSPLRPSGLLGPVQLVRLE